MIFTWNGEEVSVHHRRAGRGAAGRELGRRPVFPGGSRRVRADSRRVAGRTRRPLRDPHHRGIARGFVHRPGPADRARSSRRYGDLHQREVQVAAVPGVPAVSARSAGSTRRRRAIRQGRDVLREPPAARPHLSRRFPARLRRGRRAALPGSRFRRGRAGRTRRAGAQRLGGLGRRQHVPARGPGIARAA